LCCYKEQTDIELLGLGRCTIDETETE
jgi:hypothetical protein